MNIIAFILCVI